MPLFAILLIGGNPLNLVLLAAQLFLTTAFIPYQVSRPLKKVPSYTYSLIGINVLLFIGAVLVANVDLSLDKVDAQRSIVDYVGKEPAPTEEAAAPAPEPTPVPAPAPAAGNNAATEAPAPVVVDEKTKARLAAATRQKTAITAARDDMHTAARWKKMWQIQHSDSAYVLEPHYSVQSLFGYTPGQPRPWGLLGSLFLQSSIMILLGNMLYLWAFGRALEETFGPLSYVGSYVAGGIVTALLYHVLVGVAAPNATGAPLMGASGAVAGVLGLFAVRFSRTPVKIFSAQPPNIVLAFVGALVAGSLGGILMGMVSDSLALIGFFGGFLLVWAGLLIALRGTLFTTIQMLSTGVVAIWLAVFNLLPALAKMVGGEPEAAMAHFASLGGFAVGMLFAVLSGSKGERALEYELEDAQKAYDTGAMDTALERAENVVLREPNNPGAFEVIAKVHDHKGNENGALDNYEIAIQKYLQTGERDAAVTLYQHALKKNPGFILEPKMQFALGNQMAKNAQYKEAADNLSKIPFTFPEAPEGELALLRAAQVNVEHLDNLEMATYLLNTLLQRYPDTHWMEQVQRVLKIIDYKTYGEAEAQAPTDLPKPPPAPSNRPQAQLPPVK